MAGNFYPVAGSELKMTIGSPGTLTKVVGVTNLAFSGGDATDIDVTSIDDLTEQFIGGRLSAKELGFQMFLDITNAVHVAMIAAYNASPKVAVPWSLIDADPGLNTDTFSAYVKNMNKKKDVNGATAYDVTLKLTTVITTTP